MLSSLFPAAKMLRADSDTLQHPEQMRQVLDDMRRTTRGYSAGTQSVVKGLDLPR
jgi:primosomal protein N'